jgi:NAD(P)H-hydrate epimerase
MATGGSGDMLTGVVLALLAQGYSATDAARMAVYVHGMAGDFAAAAKGYTALIAGDIADYLHEVWRFLERKEAIE